MLLNVGGEYKLLSNNTLTFAFTNQMAAVYDPKTDRVDDGRVAFRSPVGVSLAIRRGRSFPMGICCSGRSLPRLWPSLIHKTLTWTNIVSSHAKDDVFAEEGLTLLPDGSVLTVNMTDYNFAQGAIFTIPTRQNQGGLTQGRPRSNCRPRIATARRTSSLRQRTAGLPSSGRDRPGDPPAGRHSVQQRRGIARTFPAPRRTRVLV